MTDGRGDGERDGARAQRAGSIALVAIVAAYLLHCVVVNRVTDDCYITFRYVRNWVAGFGPVFNPGERPVEGYTNFLWTALLALAHAALRNVDLLLVAQALSLAFGAATLVGVARLARAGVENGVARSSQQGWVWLVAPALLAFHAPFVAWSTGALETTLYACLILAATSCELRVATARADSGRRAWLPPLFVALATMTRPDGALFLVGIVAMRLLGPPAPARIALRSRLRSALAAVVLFALVYGPYWLWRFHYYGYPVPNTFYAKVGSGLEQWKRGVRYLLSAFSGNPGPTYLLGDGPWLALFGLWTVIVGWRDRATRLIVAQLACGFFYVVAVGGESLGMFRFLAPLSPLLVVLATWGLADLARRVRRAPRFVLIAGALVALVDGAVPTLGRFVAPRAFSFKGAESGLNFPDPGVHPYRWFDNYFVDRLAAAGRWLDQHADPGALVASTPAGSIGYHMRQPLLDMLGLNDAHIAHVVVSKMGRGRAGHEKGDGRYVLARDPEYILLGNVSVYDHPLDDAEIEKQLCLKSEHEIWADPEFHRRYEHVVVHIADAGLFQWFTFYRRKRDAPPPRVRMTADD